MKAEQKRYGWAGKPVKDMKQTRIPFTNGSKKQSLKCSQKQALHDSLVVHLFPTPNEAVARREAKAFHDYLHRQPLWIQLFRANKSESCRNLETDRQARVEACVGILKQFYEDPSCNCLTIVGHGRYTLSKAKGKSFEDQLASILLVYPSLKDDLYKRIRLHSREFNKQCAKKPSTFALGVGHWKTEHTFLKGRTTAFMTKREQESNHQFTQPGGQFCFLRMQEDARMFGHRALKEDPSSCQKGSLTVEKTNLAEEGLSAKRNAFKMVSEVESQVAMKGLVSLRSRWEDVFTANCELSPTNPCTKCRGCRQRFAQGVFVVIAAAGVSDENILAVLGSVFRSEYYRNYSIEEWAVTPLEEFVVIYRPCSKQVQNAWFTKLVLEYLSTRSLPTQLHELTCLRGLQKKSACLLLQAALGRVAGIPVDRHLLSAGKALGWIPEDCHDTFEASLFLEPIVPEGQYADMNNVVSGLCQAAAKSQENKNFILETADNMGEPYYSTLNKMFQKPEGKKDSPKNKMSNKRNTKNPPATEKHKKP